MDTKFDELSRTFMEQLISNVRFGHSNKNSLILTILQHFIFKLSYQATYP